MPSWHGSKLILTGCFVINSPYSLESMTLLRASECFLLLKCTRLQHCLSLTPAPPLRPLLSSSSLQVLRLPFPPSSSALHFLASELPCLLLDSISTAWSFGLVLSLLTCACTDPGQLIAFPEDYCSVSSPWLRKSSLSHVSREQIQSHRQCCMTNIIPENVFPLWRGLSSSFMKQNLGIYSSVRNWRWIRHDFSAI